MKKKNWSILVWFALVSFIVGVVLVVGFIQGKLFEPIFVSFFLVYGFVLIPIFCLIRLFQMSSENIKKKDERRWLIALERLEKCIQIVFDKIWYILFVFGIGGVALGTYFMIAHALSGRPVLTSGSVVSVGAGVITIFIAASEMTSKKIN